MNAKLPRIKKVKVLKDYKIALEFTDGAKGTVDLSDLVGQGVFQLWEDYEVFGQVRIGDSGELIWSEHVDLCPDWLYMRMTGKRPEEIFDKLARDHTHA